MTYDYLRRNLFPFPPISQVFWHPKNGASLAALKAKCTRDAKSVPLPPRKESDVLGPFEQFQLLHQPNLLQLTGPIEDLSPILKATAGTMKSPIKVGCKDSGSRITLASSPIINGYQRHMSASGLQLINEAKDQNEVALWQRLQRTLQHQEVHGQPVSFQTL